MKIDYPRAGKTGARRLVPSWKQVLAFSGLGVLLASAGFVALYLLTPIPDVNAEATSQGTVITFSDGQTEIAKLGANRTIVSTGDMPQHLRDAVTSAEDRDFYEHGGFSPVGISRALWSNLTSESGTQGGSTITQQLAKNLYLTQEKTLSRKAKELVISMKMEQQLSKEQILTDYLNTIYFGRGAYGVEAAAQAYFGKSVGALTVSESAVLAAVVRSPGLYSPEENPALLQARWEYVLAGMVEGGTLSQEDRDAQVFPTIVPPQERTKIAGTNGYLYQVVLDELITRGFTQEEIDAGGLRVTSTFDVGMQQAAVDAVAEQGAQENAEGVRYGVVSIDPQSGQVKALYGGADFATQQFNDATQSRPQAGSTFKPFTLVAALEDGITLQDRYSGASPQEFEGVSQPINNFGGRSYGKITVAQATANSVNTVYMAMNMEVDPGRTTEVAHRAGIPETTPLTELPSNVLGADSVTAYEMASAYGTFAAEGWHSESTAILEVRRANGAVLYAASDEREQVFDTDVMANTTAALRGVVEDGSGSYAGRLGRESAGKTGTSSNNLSAWYVGYVPQLTTAVTMFKPDADGNLQPMQGVGGLREVTGGSFPVRIWTAYMQRALEGVEEMPFPTPSAVPSKQPSRTPTLTPTPTQVPSPTDTPTPTDTPVPTSGATEPSSPARQPGNQGNGQGPAASPPAGGPPRPSSPAAATPSAT